MKFVLLTIFPEYFDSPLETSLLGKAVEKGLVSVERIDPRDYTDDVHRTVDDLPFGGGAGMVMLADPLVRALEDIKTTEPVSRTFLMSPRGAPLTQARAQEIAAMERVVLVCGRYEGVDQRVIDGGWIDEELSIGDYVLAGGETAALTVIEVTARLLPGVMGNAVSLDEESHGSGRLEYPHYTRPREFRGAGIPDVLLSGHHAEIARWRRSESLRLTRDRRPDLIDRHPLTDDERKLLDSE
ncbi:MAG: tRNA (guanosine(37)-N1)-methyltransferase TrmD [Pseudomonadota bacterium]